MDFNRYRLWCKKHSEMQHTLYQPTITDLDWRLQKEEYYNTTKITLNQEHHYYKNMDDLIEKAQKDHENFGGELYDNVFKFALQTSNHYKRYNALKDKETWIKNCELSIAEFNKEELKYLLWKCSIPFIREFLKKCNIKIRWYHKLFCKIYDNFN